MIANDLISVEAQTVLMNCAQWLSYGFLLWTVQGTCGVQDCLLGVVEELRDVL